MVDGRFLMSETIEARLAIPMINTTTKGLPHTRKSKPDLQEPTLHRIGRPTSYRAHFVEQVRKLAKFGAIMSEIAEFLGVEERTIRRWRHVHPELDEALKIGADAANLRVEASLYNQALGYWIDDEEIRVIAGNIVRVKVRRFIPPNVSASIYWTKVKMGWRDNGFSERAKLPEAEELPEETPRQIARRIAFLLSRGEMSEK